MLKTRRLPHPGWLILIALVIAAIGTVFWFWLDYQLIRNLEVEVERLGGSITVQADPDSQLVNWAKAHDAARLVEWLRTDIDVLEFSGEAIDDEWLSRLRRYRNIRSLVLKNTRITDAGLASLKSRKKLTTLVLDGSAVTDAGMSSLATLPDLHVLSLSRTGITDAALIALKPLSQLVAVRVDDTRITDNGLKTLTEFPALKHVDFIDTQITYDAAMRYRKKYRDVAVFGP